AASIGRTLACVRSFLDGQGYEYEVIVAADGDDATPDIVRDVAESWPNLKLTAEAGPHGKSHGLRAGVHLATGDIIGFLDADYKTPIEEVLKVLPWLSDGYDIVAGSRGLAESRIQRKQRWYRQLGSRVFGIGMHSLIGLHHIRDTQ